MRRTLTIAVLAAALTSGVASASRPATHDQRDAVVKAAKAAGDLSASFPPRCAKVRISTVNDTWASLVIRVGARVPSSCKPFAANGISVFHKRHRHWRFVTAGSSFETCPPAHMPVRVAHDLKVC